MNSGSYFDILKIPLSGFHLLDASAGTGKTYTLSGLFLRLILEKGLEAGEILVVTYTRAATGDLRTRIRARLAECLAVLQGGSSEDPFIIQLIATVADRQKAEAGLYEALVNFDEAAIFTIHGFCQRILQENSLETGTAFDLEVETDIQPLLREVVLDYWRLTSKRVTPGLLAFAGNRLQPENLIRLAGKLRAGLQIIPEIDRQRLKELLDGGELSKKEKGVYDIIAEARILWQRDGKEIRELLTGSDVLHKAFAKSLRKCFAELDLLFSDISFYFQKLPEALRKLSRSFLTEKTRKNQEVPQHFFFDTCEELIEHWSDLEEIYEFLVVALRVEALDFVDREFAVRKEKSGLISYDDLLLYLARALEDEAAAGFEQGSERLASLIRRKYKAALIDEFQDTDPLQYQIFSRVYQGNSSTLLYIIGDPKQAIYSFRGADVFSYLKAVRSAFSRENLTVNFRSEPGLIRALNTVFSRQDYPFLFKEIPFSPVYPAEKEDRDLLLVNGVSEASFKLWLGTRTDGDNRLINKKAAVKSIVTALSSEICSLLRRGRNGDITIGGRFLRAGDIAVLVRKNKEALLVRDGLKEVGVGGVIQVGGDLFKTREAEELEFVLQAMADPFNETAIRSALATGLFPETVATIAGLEAGEEGLEDWSLRFLEYHDLWQYRGFMPMFRFFLEREGLRSHLLRFFDGERRLTNVLHLGEILERYTREHHKGITSVLRYLSENRQSGEAEIPEERQMRLESDEEKVRIITIHTSKGLQYPVVFCPFSWGTMEPVKQEDVLFHSSEDYRPCLDIGSADWAVHLEAARRESLAEELRIRYVALTRAINRCYLVWGPFNTTRNSALAWLLHGLPDSAGRDLKCMSDEDIFADLKPLVEQSRGEIEIGPLPGDECFLRTRFDQDAQLPRPVFRGNVPADFRIASFSYMAGQDKRNRERQYGEMRQSGEEMDFFPGGAKAGNFFHDLLENLDFRGITDDYSLEIGLGNSSAFLVDQKLRDYGYDPDWRDPVRKLLKKTVTTPLDGNNLKLKDLDQETRLSEMGFYFPLSPLSGELVSRVLGNHGGIYGEMAGLGFPEIRGFMKGYIDLIFFWKGRYYIVDWKTNYLGVELKDYQAQKLERVMTGERYILQYLIYTVALHQYLKSRLPRYRYQEHFGGVYYLFLRGMEPDLGSKFGVYYDLPPDFLIRDLVAIFNQNIADC
ncbi:MAG: exodeoxyribonuclease V subunit beta [Thermodesulfobacteriota bacterium]